ncbi:MAG TPA: hypothetical protein VGK99_10090 [Acidobacteriota bacterium]|jgi:hypothetical protein
MARSDQYLYPKQLLRSILGDRWDDSSERRKVDMGGTLATLDGVILDKKQNTAQVAVDIEARTEKQIRGAMVDLLFHPAPNKLLIIMPNKNFRVMNVERHCAHVWKQLATDTRDNFRTVIMAGDVSDPDPDDRQTISRSLAELGVL